MKDKNGIVYQYPDRSCKSCAYYPCLIGEDFVCDFAKYGCLDFKLKIK